MVTTKVRSTKLGASQPKSDKPKISVLLKKLAGASTQQDKRQIRRGLRSLGHRGGLGKAKKVTA